MEGKRKGRILLIGNPGVGKSTLINTLLGEKKCKSGLSDDGGGVTLKKNSIVFTSGPWKGWEICDTPGLADAKQAELAKKGIEDALKGDCDYKVIFVMTLESNRVRAQEKAAIMAVLNAVEGGFNYGVVVNKVTQRAEKKLRSKEDLQEILKRCFCMGLDNFPHDFCILNRDDDADDADMVLLPEGARQKLMNLIKNIPSLAIPVKNVTEVIPPDEKLVKELQKQLEETRVKYKAELARLEKKQAKQRQKMESMKQTFEEKQRSLQIKIKKIDKERRAAEAKGELAVKEAEKKLAEIKEAQDKIELEHKEKLDTLEKKMEKERKEALDELENSLRMQYSYPPSQEPDEGNVLIDTIGKVAIAAIASPKCVVM
eukprot:CAMPEP_0167764048 /NCGR_PEP_ID=MMETSP0110_2-20121227/13778_1 /TAXON_ID=629695 /ORGANISM="Gymnochlora sp., Strain CCMP2014" /LENGTH=371 /DNA_ID=CAMNT_0007651333 /DNA_START=28 /DNA_END=1143 /DNA_ORIENTATION=-